MRRLARHHDKPSACGAASLQVAAVGRPAPHSRLSPRAAVRTLRLFRFPSLQKSQRWPNTHQHNMRRPPQIRERRRAGSELFDNVLPAGHRPVRQGIFLCPVLGSSRRPRISNYIVSLCAQPLPNCRPGSEMSSNNGGGMAGSRWASCSGTSQNATRVAVTLAHKRALYATDPHPPKLLSASRGWCRQGPQLAERPCRDPSKDAKVTGFAGSGDSCIVGVLWPCCPKRLECFSICSLSTL